MDSLTVKTIAVFAIIFGCFAVLYPKIFHPILTNMFGATPARHMDDDTFRPPRPGNLHKSGKGGKHRNGPSDDFPPHMRGGPHPGMRAAAEMKKQMAPPGGNSGRGMMGIVLPMYAVGIVIYLIYTLTKTNKTPESRFRYHQTPKHIHLHHSDSNDRTQSKVKTKITGRKKLVMDCEEIDRTGRQIPVLCSNDQNFITSTDKAECFAEKPTIPEAENEKPVPHVHKKTHAQEDMCTGRHAFLNKIVFWPKKVKKILQKLDIENANGPDSIPARRRMSVDVYMLSSAYSVFGGKKKDDDYLTSHFKEEHKKKKRHHSNEDMTSKEDQADQYRKVKQSQKDLEKLLIKADKDDLSECDMRDLKHRLLDTERQMTRILQAMQDVQEKVADLSGDLSDSEEDSEESVGEQMEKLEKLVQKRHQAKSTPTVDAKQEEQKPPTEGEKVADSSPDMESYEIVSGKQESDKCPVPDNTPVAETIGPMEATESTKDDQLTSELAQGSGDTELDAAAGPTGKEEMIPCGDTGESGDHSELRKRTPAVAGIERQ